MRAHLAQINIGTMRAPTDDPRVAEFMDNLDRINAQADSTPGFVWRLQTDDGNATSIQIFPNPLQLVNMSVWESVATLKEYVYRTEHVEFFRRRAEWFESDAKRLALWWIPADTVPELDDAVRRLEFQERHGPTGYSFGFGRQPDPLVIVDTTLDDRATLDLVSRFSAELPGATHLGSSSEQVTDDRGAMIAAVLAGMPVACGAIRRVDDGRGEITQLYVAPEARGRRIGAAILDQLELRARRMQLGEVVLEAMVDRLAATNLFEASGYLPTERLGDDLASPATGRCYHKVW